MRVWRGPVCVSSGDAWRVAQSGREIGALHGQRHVRVKVKTPGHANPLSHPLPEFFRKVLTSPVPGV
jgi:hypothetical protein